MPPLENYPAPSLSAQERESHLFFMRAALSQAQLALSVSETPVACVFVHDGQIIGRGMNDTNRSFNGTRHAEFIALNDILSAPEIDSEGRVAGRKYGPEVLRECTLYVTVEPCIMCASLLRQVGVKRVFYGASNEKFGGTGGVLKIHEGNGKEVGWTCDTQVAKGEGDYEVSGGWLREECIVILRRFYVQENERAPEEKRSKEGRVLRLDVEPIGEGVGGG